MATLYLTCGLQGSGKTTLARQLETRHGALRLTADEWLHELYPDLSDGERDARRDGVEAVQWRLTQRVLELGCDVVLDRGLRRRLDIRNADRPAGTFVISSDELEGAAAFFQRPTDDELSLFDPT